MRPLILRGRGDTCICLGGGHRSHRWSFLDPTEPDKPALRRAQQGRRRDHHRAEGVWHRVVRSVRPMARGRGRMSAKTNYVPKTGLSFWALYFLYSIPLYYVIFCYYVFYPPPPAPLVIATPLSKLQLA